LGVNKKKERPTDKKNEEGGEKKKYSSLHLNVDRKKEGDPRDKESKLCNEFRATRRKEKRRSI